MYTAPWMHSGEVHRVACHRLSNEPAPATHTPRSEAEGQMATRARTHTRTERVDASAAHTCAHSMHARHVADRPPASVSTPELCPISRCSTS